MSKQIGRRKVLAAGLAMPALLRVGTARAQSGRPFKLAIADTVASPVYAVCQRFAASVKEKSGGAMEIQVYGAGQLGSQSNTLNSIQTGIIDMSCHTTGFIDTIIPQCAVLDLPYLFKDASAAERLLDGPVGEELFKLFPAKGIQGLCWGHWGWRPISTTATKPATTPAELAGTKIRLQPGAIYAETYRLLGAVPTAIDISEVYLALSQGAVGAVELPYISMVANKLQEVLKHTNDTNIVYNAGAIMISKRRFDAMPAEQQAVLRACAKDTAIDWRKSVAVATEQAKGVATAAGMTIAPVDEAAYAKATRPVYDKFRDIIGADLMDQVLKQVGA